MEALVIPVLIGLVAGLLIALQRPPQPIEIVIEQPPETAAGSLGCAPFVAFALATILILALVNS